MEEPKETKSLIPLSDENKEINNHLEDKLIYHFFSSIINRCLRRNNYLYCLFNCIYKK